MFPPESQYHARPEPHPKTNLKTWWHHFNFVQKTKKETQFGEPYRAHDTADHPVFGKSLKESLHYASVQISTADANGDLYVWGYIPVVVAKCGLYLKEHATEIPGTFRVNGSNKRMRHLQAAFETPPRYGKSLDWKAEAYTTHDVASVFRRYLTQMPEPVIPHEMYHDFRDALAKKPYNQDEVILTYKAVIRRMPRSNQYLLLYVLDLLSVFARKAEKNLMTATNLAVIFRPGIISHPSHEMSPQEHSLSQQVLEFLIAHQDWFMLDIIPPMQAGDSHPGEDPYGAGGAGGPSHQGGGGGSRGDYPDRGAGGGGGGAGGNYTGAGKWREGTSTPTRQGTMESGWTTDAGPSSVHRTKTTTRQRVISGAPDVGAWHSNAGASSGMAAGNRRASVDQRAAPTPSGSNGWARNERPERTERRASAQQYGGVPGTTSRQATMQTHVQSPGPAQSSQDRRPTADSYFPADAQAYAPQTTRKNNPAVVAASNNLTTRPSMASQTSSSSTQGHSGAESVFATPMSSMPPSPASSLPGHGHGYGYAAQQAAPPPRSRGQYPPPSGTPGLAFPGSHGQYQQQPPPSSFSKPHVRTNSMPTPPPPQTYTHPRNAPGSTPYGLPSDARNMSPEPIFRHHEQSTPKPSSYPQQQQRQPRVSPGGASTPTTSTSTVMGAALRPPAIYTTTSSNSTLYARGKGHMRSASSPSTSPLPSPMSETFSDAVIEETMTVPAVGPREEFSTLGGGGWRLVSPQINGGGYLTLGDVAGMDQSMRDGGKNTGKQERSRAKMMRRRTTMDRADLVGNTDVVYETAKDIMPITEDADSGIGGLSRSRTLPSRRKNPRGEQIYDLNRNENKENTMGTDEEGNDFTMNAMSGNVKVKQEKRVLKKQRRASAGQKVPAAANGM
ncbi:hypothetical protein D9619_004210 [Psilocybe cf. subviscida]|uniref:Rho-GAP domain-containing protein n=1 Tax=Psilocybe cf. subviscida TaxID=2480587 RepID=A0A8H5F7V3_9AGAR|nr:hypothetical protein D9619_004210 [Psilocybe cf. subviscida]